MRLIYDKEYVNYVINEIKRNVIYDIYIGVDKKSTIGTLAYNLYSLGNFQVQKKLDLYPARCFKFQLLNNQYKKLLINQTFRGQFDNLNDINNIISYNDMLKILNGQKRTCPRVLTYQQINQRLNIPKQVHCLQSLILN